MKLAVALLVLAAFLASDASVVRAPMSRANLILGSKTSSDRLLQRYYLRKNAINNAVQYEDAVYRGQRNTSINFINATEIGGTQFANAFIIAGGIRANNVTVRAQSARGRGYNYQLEIWGR